MLAPGTAAMSGLLIPGIALPQTGPPTTRAHLHHLHRPLDLSPKNGKVGLRKWIPLDQMLPYQLTEDPLSTRRQKLWAYAGANLFRALRGRRKEEEDPKLREPSPPPHPPRLPRPSAAEVAAFRAERERKLDVWKKSREAYNIRIMRERPKGFQMMAPSFEPWADYRRGDPAFPPRRPKVWPVRPFLSPVLPTTDVTFYCHLGPACFGEHRSKERAALGTGAFGIAPRTAPRASCSFSCSANR